MVTAMSGRELKAARERLGLTQAELAKAVGVQRVTVARWEAGLRKIPPMLTLAMKTLSKVRRKRNK